MKQLFIVSPDSKELLTCAVAGAVGTIWAITAAQLVLGMPSSADKFNIRDEVELWGA